MKERNERGMGFRDLLLIQFFILFFILAFVLMFVGGIDNVSGQM